MDLSEFETEEVIEESDFDAELGAEFDLTELDLETLALPESENKNDNNALAEELSDVAFTENIPLPKIEDEIEPFIDIETLLANSNDVISEELDFDLEMELDAPPTETHLEDTNGVENQISTQLDLARAYLEIDDKSGAKDILDGIIDKSEGKQRKEIDKLLKKLG